MNPDLSVLRDPFDGSELNAVDPDCLVSLSGKTYPIVNGIPRFVPSDNYASDFGAQWNRFPRTQLDSHVGLPISADRLRRCLGGDLATLQGKLVLEAGSGAGRFTEVLIEHGATVHSFDFSSAVEANARNNGASDRLTLAQADIRSIPFASAAYDIVICLGVLQHTPSPEESIASLWKMVKPGGQLVIDHYTRKFINSLPPPLGGARPLYRRWILSLPPEQRFSVVEKITKFWFPLHWTFRNSRLARRLLWRVSPLAFYYPELPLGDRETFFTWSLLDTHDSTTDYFKHFRTGNQIAATLEGLGAIDVVVRKGGNGVEARCSKPPALNRPAASYPQNA